MIALNDTWDSAVNVKNTDGDRLWVQEGGEIKNDSRGYHYDTVRWYPVPNIENNEGLLFPEVSKEWKWQDFILTASIQDTRFLAQYFFDTSSDLVNVMPIDNLLGKMEILLAPAQFGADNGILHLFTPDGSPIGFGLDTIFPEDFAIEFKYAGLGDGVLQLLLDDNVFRELDFNTQSLDELSLFNETFHASALGVEPYRLHRLSFILKSTGDPELYFDDLFVRNLDFQNPGVGVPESRFLMPLCLGLVGLIFKSRNFIKP